MILVIRLEKMKTEGYFIMLGIGSLRVSIISPRPFVIIFLKMVSRRLLLIRVSIQPIRMVQLSPKKSHRFQPSKRERGKTLSNMMALRKSLRSLTTM